MSKFIINGPAKLRGEIEVRGAKNAALKIIPAAILSTEKITIANLPEIEDVKQSLALLEDLGAKIDYPVRGTVIIDTSDVKKTELNPAIANKFRASIMFVAPLLARFGEAKFPHPGGCIIGAGKRDIDVFLDGFAALGAEINIKDDYYHLRAKGGLEGGEFFFYKLIAVTATESMIMAATLAKGRTVLKNCAMEPEIKALADYLNRQGAKISGAGTPTIIIDGTAKISAGSFTVMPDRLEAGSFAIMAAATGSEILIKKCAPEHLRVLLEIFQHRLGIPFEEGADWLKIKPAKKISAYGIKTHEYPGFPTDLQQPYAVLMTQAQGSSLIHETIFDRRLLYADLLSQMGADIIMCDPHRIVVNGPTKLYGHKLTSPDLRAGIALVIAALVAQGRTEIDNIYQIERGYENIAERLAALGADIKKI
ncbi:MAG TPA: UDP-N-acetylglucosamine 1-carboxyvinyltransferase [Candidatus Nanoarchaeia archaeon]|nr:UDP-N-acetylglucosamine 1-carboxyvinyltransferase [Candidatus Nanoarchaeia archaeon]